ncbi:hypothetical protein [Mesorhizobium amorphae]
MLDDLSAYLDQEKAGDLVQRLESKKVDQALPGEMELAILWAIANTGDIVIEPDWWGDTRRPDAISETVVLGKQVAVEIAAATDNSISPEEAMDRVALSVTDFCNRMSKGVGDHLYFRFGETTKRIDGRSFRKVLAPFDFQLSEELGMQLKEWVREDRFKSEKIVLNELELLVEVEWKTYRQVRYHNIWTSLPPQAYSLEENPLFALLRRKADQLRAASTGTVRIIIVADVGSTLLNRMGRIGENDPGGQNFSARQIIGRFIQLHNRKIDGVLALSPRKELRMGGSERKWIAQGFYTHAGEDACLALSKILEALPLPRFAGYQARSLFRQGSFSPKAMGWYLGISMESKLRDKDDPKSGRQESVKIPARMFLDLMAGRLTEKQFRYLLGERDGEKNVFTGWLNKGLTISGVEMAPRSLDEEDDHLILHFGDDPVARPLTVAGKADS